MFRALEEFLGTRTGPGMKELDGSLAADIAKVLPSYRFRQKYRQEGVGLMTKAMGNQETYWSRH